MNDCELKIIELAKQPGGVSLSKLTENKLPVSDANKLFCAGVLSIDIPITKNPTFRFIRKHKYAA